MTSPFLTSLRDQLAALTGLEPEALGSLLQRASDPAHGDYAFPCFVLAKKARRNPVELARDLVGRFVPDAWIERAEAKGPYLNFFVRGPAYVEHVLRRIHEQGEDYGSSQAGVGRTVVIDFSSPNIAKPLGVHHLCSTMIGNCLCRVFQCAGYHVAGINHLGDWGTQFGVLLAAYGRWGDASKAASVNGLVELYVRYSRAMEADESLRAEARDWFRRLEKGDEKARTLWERFRQTSLDEFQRVYQRLGVRFDSFAGESFYNDKQEGILGRLREAGLARMSQDALVVDLSDFKMPPCILLKSDEGSLYATRDLAAIDYRLKTYGFDKALYVVGSDQRLHFRQVFKVLELMHHEAAGRCVHVNFGLVLFKDPETGEWSKGSTRRGNLELLEDVLNRAAELALGIIDQNEKKLQFESSKEQIAEGVGIAAVVFNILATSRQKDVKFDWDEVLSFRGQTGPYLQYAHARQASILRRHGKPVTASVSFPRLDDPEEFELVKALDQFPGVIERVTVELEPMILCNYLLELVSLYSRYSQDSLRHKVLSDDPELTAARVLLVSCVRTVLQKGLGLLGIAAPSQM